MKAEDIAKWFWDIAKYVVSAIIISSFLGGFKEDVRLLYLISFAVTLGLVTVGSLIYLFRNKKWKHS
jgi:hypothetical protein